MSSVFAVWLGVFIFGGNFGNHKLSSIICSRSSVYGAPFRERTLPLDSLQSANTQTMSHERYLFIAASVVLAAAYVLARPQKEFVLSDVANKTMCPIEVEINYNPDRIPSRIKYLKCAARPNKLCSEHHISHGCCRQHHHAFVTECVEIYDWVQVTFKGQDTAQAIKVPVGCTCLIEETTAAAEVS
ncbi:unnamed protein product [Spodoptera exigua]|nr:unnamed protein product [Spodoptera exigua]